MVSTVQDFGIYKRLSSDLGEVRIHFDAPILQNLRLLEFFNQGVDPSVSIVRVVELVLLKLLHLKLVLGEIFSKGGFMTEFWHDERLAVFHSDYEKRLIGISNLEAIPDLIVLYQVSLHLLALLVLEVGMFPFEHMCFGCDVEGHAVYLIYFGVVHSDNYQSLGVRVFGHIFLDNIAL